jgi:hypothetical protein
MRAHVRCTAAVVAALVTVAAAMPQDKDAANTVRNITKEELAKTGQIDLTFLRKGIPAAGIPVFVQPQAAPPVAVGRTDSAGALSLQAAIGGLPTGTQVKVTHRRCENEASILVGATPARQEGCDDDKVGAFTWGPGSFRVEFGSGGFLTPRNAGIGGAALVAGGLAIGLSGGSSSAAPPARTTTGTTTPPTTNTSTPTNPPAAALPSPTTFNGTYRGTFTRRTNTCGFFVASFLGMVDILTAEDGALTLVLTESIRRTGMGTLRSTGATTATGTATGSGVLPGGIPFTARYGLEFNSATLRMTESITLPDRNCTDDLEAMMNR